MKIIKSLFAFTAFFALQPVSAKSITARWPQIKAYHEAITTTHNACKEGDFKTVKHNIPLLSEAAATLCVENMPEEFRTPKTIETLLLLKKKTAFIEDLTTKKATNKEIKIAMTELAQTFKTLVKMCQPEK